MDYCGTFSPLQAAHWLLAVHWLKANWIWTVGAIITLAGVIWSAIAKRKK